MEDKTHLQMQLSFSKDKWLQDTLNLSCLPILEKRMTAILDSVFGNIQQKEKALTLEI